MGKFRALLVLNLKAMLSSFKFGGRKNRARAASGVGALVFMAVLAIYIASIYSFTFARQLAPIGMLPLLLMLMGVLSVGMGFLFTIFGAQGVIFGGKDNDLMLSMPVSAFALMLSRTLALYLENAVFSVFFLLPAGAAYLYFGGGGGIGFLLLLVLCALLLALLPTLLALIGGFLLAWLSSKFTRRTLITNVLYLGSFLLTMVLMFRLNTLMMVLAQSATGIQQGFSGWGLPFQLLADAVCNGNLLALVAFAGLCVGPFLLAVWLFGLRYKYIVTSLSARGARSDYKLGRITATSQRRALLKKEVARFFGTPIYFFNCGIGLILILLATGAGVVMRGKILDFFSMMDEAGVTLPLLPIMAAMLLFLLSTVAITGSSISLEGKHLWILKEAPVDVRDLFFVKVGFQLLLTLPCLLIATLVLGLSFSLPPVPLAVLFVAESLFCLLTALFGLYINLCFPKLDATNDTVVVKQSAASMISIFGGMLLAFLLAVFYWFMQTTLGELGTLSACALLCLAGSGLLIWLLNTRGVLLFEEL